MYLPRHFQPTDAAAMHALIRAHALATVVSGDAAHGLDANHLPLLPVEAPDGLRLQGHVPRKHPLAAQPGASVLAIFRGPDAYVSPGWYPSKAEHGRVVPTWNYAVVQAHGRLRVIDDPAWLRQHLDALSARHEASQARPWTLQEAPEDYLAGLVAALVGIEIAVRRLEGKFKLSQNHPPANRAGVLDGLRRGGGHGQLALAELMAGMAEGSVAR